MDKRNLKILLAMALILAAVFMLALLFGSSSYTGLSFIQSLQADDFKAWNIFRLIRLPRACGALIAGAALSCSGYILQQVLANPLASPNIIGTSSGAGLGVLTAAILFPYSFAMQTAGAFMGALGACLLILSLSRALKASRITLVLAGLAISQIFSAGIDLAVTINPDLLVSYSDFKIGGLSNLAMSKLALPAFTAAAALSVSLIFSKELDLFELGQDSARALGMNYSLFSFLFIVLAAAFAASAVSFAGLIGFVGLIVPHIIKRLLQAESLVRLSACALGGSILLLAGDLLSRILFAPYEIPVGILLSFAGGPFFLWLLFSQRKSRL